MRQEMHDEFPLNSADLVCHRNTFLVRMSYFANSCSSKEEVNSPQSSSSFASIKSEFLLSPLQSDITSAASPVDSAVILPPHVATIQRATPPYTHGSAAPTNAEFSRLTRFDYPSEPQSFDSKLRLSPKSVAGSRYTSSSDTCNMTYGISRMRGLVDADVKRIWFLGETVKKLYELDSDPGRTRFLDEYFGFMKMRGVNVAKIPVVAKLPLDLYRLYFIVQNLGGFAQVVKKRRWSRVVRELDLPSSITSAAFTLRTQYIRLLYPFECEKRGLSADEVSIDDDDALDDSRSDTTSQFRHASEQYFRHVNNPEKVKIESGSLPCQGFSYLTEGRLSHGADSPSRLADPDEPRVEAPFQRCSDTDSYDLHRYSLSASTKSTHSDTCDLTARNQLPGVSSKDVSSTPVGHVKRALAMDEDLMHAKRSRSVETEVARKAQDFYANANVRPRSLDIKTDHTTNATSLRPREESEHDLVSVFAVGQRARDQGLPKVSRTDLHEAREILLRHGLQQQTSLGKPPLLIKGHPHDEATLTRPDATALTDVSEWNQSPGRRRDSPRPCDAHPSDGFMEPSPSGRSVPFGASHRTGHGTREFAADGRCRCLDCVWYRRVHRATKYSPDAVEDMRYDYVCETPTGRRMTRASSPVGFERDGLADDSVFQRIPSRVLQSEPRIQSRSETEFSLVVNERTSKYLSISVRMNGTVYRGILSADY